MIEYLTPTPCQTSECPIPDASEVAARESGYRGETQKQVLCAKMHDYVTYNYGQNVLDAEDCPLNPSLTEWIAQNA